MIQWKFGSKSGWLSSGRVTTLFALWGLYFLFVLLMLVAHGEWWSAACVLVIYYDMIAKGWKLADDYQSEARGGL